MTKERGTSMKKKGKHFKRGMAYHMMVLPLLILYVTFIIYPFLSTIFYSFTDYSSSKLFDYEFVGLQNYFAVFDTKNQIDAIVHTLKYAIIITACTVIFSLLIASIAAYSITRHKSKFNKFAFTIVLAGMMIPGQVSLVTLYTLVQKLHLIDSIWGMIVINCGGNTILPLFLYKSFIATSVPVEIDSCQKLAALDEYKRKNANNEAKKVYDKYYKRYSARLKVFQIKEKDFKQWQYKAITMRDECIEGKITLVLHNVSIQDFTKH